MGVGSVDLTAPAATQQTYSAYLAEAQAKTQRALDSVSSAGSPPVEGGEQIANEVRSDITDISDDLADANNQIDQADPNSVAVIGRSVVAAGNVLGALVNNAQALGALDGNPRALPAPPESWRKAAGRSASGARARGDAGCALAHAHPTHLCHDQ